MNRSLVTIVLAMTCMSALPAESQPQLPKAMAACAEISDVAKRAACYDSEVAKLQGQDGKSAAPSAARTTPPVPAAAAPSAKADFGAESLPRLAAAEEQVLDAKIAALRELQPGVYVLTLDNGQIWNQPERRVGFELKTGDVVRIKKATMGAYRLWLDSRGPKQWVRVVRLQ